MSAITKANFAKKLSGIVASSKTLRDNVQSLIVFGLEQYRDHGDAGYLSRLVKACNDVRTVPARTVKDYIKEHANLVYGKDKNGELRFAKESKAAEITVNMPEVVWYNWEGNNSNQAQADLALAGRINGIVTSIDKAKKEERNIKSDGVPEAVTKLIKKLNLSEDDLIAIMKGAGLDLTVEEEAEEEKAA